MGPRLYAVVALGLVLLAAPLEAAVTLAFSFPVARAQAPLPLDPRLTDPAWNAGLVPSKGPWENLTTRSPASQQTQAYLLYDDEALYVAFRVQQRGAPIVATQTVHDLGFGIDDFVGIGVDTSGSGTEAYYFETTPIGTRYDQANENTRYQPRWRAAAVRTPDGWNAVMIIPLKVLHVPARGTHTWRFQFIRGIAARGEHHVWAYNGLMLDQQPNQTWPTFSDTRFWAAGTGIAIAGSASRPKPRADIYGLESVGKDYNQFQQPNQTFMPQDVRHYGIDASFPLTSTVNLVGTLNPDFSNVEIDQITIAPQEFRRQLIEYRPFFSQGSVFVNASSGQRSPTGIFVTNPNLIFYSPSIGPFDRGAKVEGSFGEQSFGVMNFRGFDPTTGNTFDDTAFGYEHALQDNSFLYWSDGVLAHHSLAGDDSTVEGGVEGRNLKSGLVGYADYSFETGSWVPQHDAHFLETFADMHRPNYEINFGYLDTAPNYNPIDGYTANSDIRGPQAFLNFYGGSSPGIKSWTLVTNVDRFLDESGAVHEADAVAALNMVFKNGLSFDGLGPAIGELRAYGIPSGPGCSGTIVATSYFTGYPCYLDGSTQAFDLMAIPIGYGDATPNPVDIDYSWGNFGGNDTHLFTTTATRVLTRALTLGLAYDGTWERDLWTGTLSSQWLRRLTLGYNIGSRETLSLSLRSINGLGGFATSVGTDVAVAFRRDFTNGDELYVNYGTPAAPATLDRLIAKFVFHVGGDNGA